MLRIALPFLFLAASSIAPPAVRAEEAAHGHAEGGMAGTKASPSLTMADPVPELLAKGVAVILFKAENIQLAPIYGEAALGVVPRLGHLHVTLDRQAWHWVHAGGDPIVLQGLPPGRHDLLLELADPAHRVIGSRTVAFTIPELPR